MQTRKEVPVLSFSALITTPRLFDCVGQFVWKVFTEQESERTDESVAQKKRAGVVWLLIIQLFNGD